MSAFPAARTLVDLLTERFGPDPGWWCCPSCEGDLIVPQDGRVRCPIGCGHAGIEAALRGRRTLENPRDVEKTTTGGAPFDALVLPGVPSADRWAAREQDVARVLPH